MYEGVYKVGDKIPVHTGECLQCFLTAGWGIIPPPPLSSADEKLRKKQKSDSNKEEEVDKAREQRKVSDNAAEKAAKDEAKKRKNFGDMAGIKAAKVAEKLANEKIARAEEVKVAERAAKADKLSALAAIAVKNLAETPSDMQSTGIPNLGCTCFFNVLLQVLFKMPYVFSNILQMDNSKHDDIITALQNVFLEMSDTSDGVLVEQETLETFFHRFGGFNNEEDTFNIYAQETPAEAAMKLIERCEKAAVNRGLEGADANWFRNISYVKCKTTYTNCQTDETRVKYTDGMPFLAITSPTIDGSVQKDLIKKVEDELAGTAVEFKWAPKDATDEETAKIPNLPHNVAYKSDSTTDNLVVDIHRNTGLIDKTLGCYGFGRKLNLFGCEYSLQSVVVHDGMTIQSGHYIAFKIVGGTWWKYDDKHVTESTWDQVMYYGFGERPGSTASMLVYGKTVSAP
ncbi:hypothetical protein T484DRAFT_1863188 [Baffinella frigidus]|nr:hypothetical protein T484DRAFT_1863188 [Cryptophyta sp. CCMP2293]